MYDIERALEMITTSDVFGICETFLNETVDDKLLTMNGYRFERKDRRECNSYFHFC